MHQDFLDLLRLLNQHQVEYLVVGGYAVSKHAEVRATKDLDIWVNPTKGNADRVFAALKVFGAPLAGLSPKDFIDRDSFYKMGIEPYRVDLLMAITPLTFEECWQRREDVIAEEVTVHFISCQDLIENKITVNRPQDIADVVKLRKALAKRESTKL